MDTKTLYDWAREADLTFDDNDDYSDAIDIWVDAWMSSPKDLEEWWIDWIANKPEKMLEMLGNVGQAHTQGNQVDTYHRSEMLRGTMSIGFTLQCAWVGKIIVDVIQDSIREHINKHVADDWADVCAYHWDMEEGRNEV